MRHVLEPYYKLFIDGKEMGTGKMEELFRRGKNSGKPYEVFAYYRSVMLAPDISPLSISRMRKASEMRSRGVSVQVIAAKLAIPPKYLSKIFIKNNLATV